MIAAIDPGKHACGVALFDQANRKLQRAWLYEVQDPFVLSVYIDIVCLELMRIYPAAQHKGDQNDLIDVTRTGAFLAGLMRPHELVTYYPREWKGTIDGDIMISRIQQKLAPEEYAAVELAGHRSHNIWDAIGIGLHYLGRLR